VTVRLKLGHERKQRAHTLLTLRDMTLGLFEVFGRSGSIGEGDHRTPKLPPPAEVPSWRPRIGALSDLSERIGGRLLVAFMLMNP
jgi:hypothetical protein